jgi:hypothetical protein
MRPYTVEVRGVDRGRRGGRALRDAAVGAGARLPVAGLGRC